MKRRHSEKEQKKLADNERLLRAWKKYHAERLNEALAGVHADVMRRLMARLADLRSARELVAFIAAQDWPAVDADTRLTALHQINVSICALRERMGQEPINDALVELGQPLNAFQLICAIINPTNFPQSRGGHDPALANPGT
jgi:hypothetical protein